MDFNISNRAKKVVSVLILAIILLFCFSTAFADVGNHTDYYSNDSSSNSSGSSGTIDSNLIFYLFSYLLGRFGFFGAFIIMVIVLVGYSFLKKSKVAEIFNEQKVVNRTNTNTRGQIDNTDEIVSKIKEHDELFSSNEFISWSKEVFMTIQDAWEDRDWNKVRPFETEELYRLHELQLKEHIEKGTINKLEEINVNRAFLAVYKKDEEYEYLTAYMSVRMIDYVIDEKTEKIIKGNPHLPVRNNYLLTFKRRMGVVTNPATSNLSTTRCPNCGAPIQVTSAGRCEYCDFIVTTGDHDWVLDNIDSL